MKGPMINDAAVSVTAQRDHRINPLLEEGPEGVIPRVICIMEYLSCVTLQENMSMNENMQYGRWLIEETMISALKYADEVAKEQLNALSKS